jgi:hypothetical protein
MPGFSFGSSLRKIYRFFQNISATILGTTYYVSPDGDDDNDGLTPETAFETITQAFATAGTRDAVRVGAGTYDEDGLDLNARGQRLTLESGVILQDSTHGIPLTVSGFGCLVEVEGNARIDATGAVGGIGVLVSGAFCELRGVRVRCANACELGFDITGSGGEFYNCRCADPTTAAFRIQGDTTKLEGCCTGGNSGATIGYWITNSADKYRLINCGSQGHGLHSFQVDAGCTNGVIWNFSSGGGDGRWLDTDHATVISNISFESEEFKDITFTATGGEGGTGTQYNLFRVYGSVQVFDIFGVVTTATPATNSTINLELWSTNAAVDITDNIGGPDLVSRVAGTTVARESVSTDPLEIGEPDGTPAIVENASNNDPRVPIILIEDDSAATYIQLVLSAALASGAMHWQIEWHPISEDGFVTPV